MVDTRVVGLVDELFGRLRSGWREARAERDAAVVRWGYASRLSGLHRPRGPLPSRFDRDGQGELIEASSAGRWDFRYGFDREDRIVVAVGDGTDLIWFDPSGETIMIGRKGERDGMKTVEAEVIFLEGERWIARECLTAYQDKGWSVHREQQRFYYEGDRLMRVLTLMIYEEGPRLNVLPHPRVDTVTYDAAGQVARSVQTYSGEPIPRSALEDDRWNAVIEWERRGGMERAALWDARLDRPELPVPLEELEDLPQLLARALRTCVALALSEGRVEQPFVLQAWMTGGELVDEFHRRRRRELALPRESPFYFPNGPGTVRLAIEDSNDDLALLRLRQWNATIRRMPSMQAAELHNRVLQALGRRLNAEPITGASEDFAAMVADSYGRIATLAQIREQLGIERTELLVASMDPRHPRKLPRGPGRLQRTEDVELLLRSRGVEERWVCPLAALARWGIRLPPGPGRSHLAGDPRLPPDMPWPHFQGRALSLLAEIELDELSEIEGRDVLPPSGTLLFFHDLDGTLEESFEPASAGEGDPARVIYLPEGIPRTLRCAPDTQVKRPALQVRPTARLTLPPEGPLLEALGLDAYDLEPYSMAYDRSLQMPDPERSHRTTDQILGHPVPIQNDPCQEDEQPLLLLAVYDNTKTRTNLADNGALYYLITEDHARQHAWHTTTVDAQSG